MSGEPVRVLSVPASHDYVEHLRDPAVGGVTWVRGPDVEGWAPSPALTAAWVDANADDVDVVHLHFGFDDRTPDELAEWVARLHAHGTALVYTVHDLRNPHHRDPGAHDAQLDVLVAAADALVTLTPGAAAEIRRRWYREALVVPHPHVVPDSLLETPRPERDAYVVGVHLKSLRANVCGLAVLAPLVDVVRELPDAQLVVDIHHELLRADFVRHDTDLIGFVRAAAERGDLTLNVHERFDDAQLWEYVLGLDLSVLPYAYGTHSGWLEACHDLGTAVLAPRVGHWHEQQPALGFDLSLDADGQAIVDEGSLRAAVRRAHATRPSWRADPAERRRQRARIAVAHRDLYRSVVSS